MAVRSEVALAQLTELNEYPRQREVCASTLAFIASYGLRGELLLSMQLSCIILEGLL